MKPPSQKALAQVGKRMEWKQTTPKQRSAAGMCIGARRVPGVTITDDDGTWPAVQFLIEDEQTAKYVWTTNFADVDRSAIPSGSNNPVYVRIKRRFAVMLEDCVLAPLPDDINADNPIERAVWARENSDRLWEEANLRREASDAGNAAEIDRLADLDYAQFRWENEHHADLDGIDDEYEVEIEEL